MSLRKLVPALLPFPLPKRDFIQQNLCKLHSIRFALETATAADLCRDVPHSNRQKYQICVSVNLKFAFETETVATADLCRDVSPKMCKLFSSKTLAASCKIKIHHQHAKSPNELSNQRVLFFNKSEPLKHLADPN